MPTLTIESGFVEVSRNSGMLDTNVLVALFDATDNDHDQAQAVIEVMDQYTWIIVPPVVVEAVALLLRRTKSHDIVAEMFEWILSPGNRAVLIPDPNHPLDLTEVTRRHSRWMSRYSVDFVDAYVMQSADKITRICDLRPAMPVFTFDTRDFFKCVGREYWFSLYDMRSADEIVDFSHKR